MGVIWIPNQPIVPKQLSNCDCNEDCNSGHCILPTDKPDIQFKIYPCEDAVTPDFNGRSTPESMEDWIYTPANGSVCSSEATTGNYFIQFPNPTGATLFELTIKVLEVTSGILVISLLDGSEVAISTPGTYTLYLSTTNLGNTRINFNSSNWIGCFTIMELELLPINTNYRLVLYDKSGLGIATFSDFDIDDNWLTAHVDLTPLTGLQGCYYFGLLDPCVESDCFQSGINNQQFLTDAFWINASEPDIFEVISPGAVLATSTSAASYIWVNETELCVGAKYKITYEIAKITDATLTQIQVMLGLSAGALHSAVGVYYDILEVLPGMGLNNQVFFNFIASAAGAQVGIKNLKVELLAEYTATEIVSQNYTISSKYPCPTLTLEGCCIGEAFGFNWTNFKPLLRIAGAVEQPQYDIDGNLYRYKSGRKEATYWDVLKQKSLNVAPAGEFIHDFLAIWMGFDNAFVNGFKVEPSESEYPTLEWEKNCIAGVSIDIEANPTKIRKVKCSESANCSPTFEPRTPYQFQDLIDFNFQDGYPYFFD